MMDKDILRITSKFLTSGFADTLNDEEKERIAKWLFTQIREERLGWRKKLQASFKEIDKERNLSRDVHEAIHDINALFKPHSATVSLLREASMYHAVEKDGNQDDIEKLRKNVTAVLNILNGYSEATNVTEAWVLQKVASKSIKATGDEMLKIRIADMEAQIVRHEEEESELETRHLGEIKILNESLELQGRYLETQKLAFDRKTRELEKEIANLRQNIKDIRCSATRTISQTRNKYCQTPFNVRECGCQTEKNLRDDSYPVNILPTRQDVTLPKPIPPKAVDSRKIISSDVAENLEEDTDEGTGTAPTMSVEIYSSNSGKHNDMKRHYENKIVNSCRSENVQQPDLLPLDEPSAHTMDTLRRKVVALSYQVQKAKEQTLYYRQQLSSVLKARQPAIEPLLHYSADNFMHTNDQHLSGLHMYYLAKQTGIKQGRLHGIKATHRPQDLGETIVATKSKAGQQTLYHRTKCLRCNSMYDTRKNFNNSCKFHSESKQIFKKYNSRGKALESSYIWTCCQQQEDSVGCQRAPHI